MCVCVCVCQGSHEGLVLLLARSRDVAATLRVQNEKRNTALHFASALHSAAETKELKEQYMACAVELIRADAVGECLETRNAKNKTPGDLAGDEVLRNTLRGQGTAPSTRSRDE